MEAITSHLSQLKIDQNEKVLHQFFIDMLAILRPEYINFKWTQSKEDEEVVDEDALDAKHEEAWRNEYEKEVSEADLDTVQVRYIPDYIRELKNQEKHWKKEYKFWGDYISCRNWTNYAVKVHEELIRNKRVLKNLDKYVARINPELGETHFSQCLDPERIQRFVDYIKKIESDDEKFSVWRKSAVDKRRFIKSYYQDYAVFARYGDFRARPSRLNLAKAAEQSRKLPRNKN